MKMQNIQKIKMLLQEADCVLIGAGSGLSTSAGFTYSGERFYKYFSDFSKKYGFKDMYSGGFTKFESLSEYWAYWSRHIYINRFVKEKIPVYKTLFNIVKDKNYFVLTTNVDHQFIKNGFDKTRLFYTQGDYGLLQCSKPCHQKTYDNETLIKKMLESKKITEDGFSKEPFPLMNVKQMQIPYCPKCGSPMSVNLRCDNTFVEDAGFKMAKNRYLNFLEKNLNQNKKVVFLELGVGTNTPLIIKYPFWNMTHQNQNATYICINKGETFAPKEIEEKSICINCDIYEVLKEL